MNVRKIRTHGSNGCENFTRLAVSAALLALTACGGGGSDDEAELDLSNLQDLPPSIGAATDGTVNAATDVIEIAAGQVVNVGILNNDNIPAGTKFQLVGQPANGTAELLDSGELKYTANADFEGTDSVNYVLVAADGTQSQGTLYIAVACADCLAEEQSIVATTNEEGFPYCQDKSSDLDGDGWGWENGESCAPSIGAALPTLAANPDSVTMQAGDTTAVSTLRNDSIPDRTDYKFEIEQPTVGSIEAAEAGVVVYSAPEAYEGTESLMYTITDAAGNQASASIDFNIQCPLCTVFKGLRLSWPANPDGENVESYQVFFGPDENTHTSTMLTEVSAEDFTGSAPNTVYDIANDLNLSGTEGGCFRVTAVRGSEESEPSDPICFTLG